MKKLKVAILKETKTPPDKRAVLAPDEALKLVRTYPNIDLVVQSSDLRAYTDEEYRTKGVKVVDSVEDCDILLGVKEVKIDKLIDGKTYFFFSHTAKKQAYNQDLLQALLEKNIRMIDHEYLTDTNGARLVAFGRWAGLVGAYNGLIAYGKRTGLFNLKRAIDCLDLKEMFGELKKIKLDAVKIVVTGGGRVAHGALETLGVLNIAEVSPEDFLTQTYNHAVFTRLDPQHYVKHSDGSAFDLAHFFDNPKEYESTFLPYTKAADMYIACHFWDQKSPKFFTKADTKSPDFKLRIIADVSCDIADPIPSTLRPSEIADPFFGYNLKTGEEANPFEKGNITVMAVDNLPGEVPRDASTDFGKVLSERVLPALFGEDTEGILERATITQDGKLSKHFTYLQDFADGK